MNDPTPLTPGDIAAAHLAAFLDARAAYAESIGPAMAQHMVSDVIVRQIRDGSATRAIKLGVPFTVMVDEGVPLLGSDLHALLAEREALLEKLAESGSAQ